MNLLWSVPEKVHVDRVCEVDEDAVTPATEGQGMVVARLRKVVLMKKFIEVPSLNSRDRMEVRAQVKLVNGVIGNLVGSVGRLVILIVCCMRQRLQFLRGRGFRQERD